jgi:hypothetical protein
MVGILKIVKNFQFDVGLFKNKGTFHLAFFSSFLLPSKTPIELDHGVVYGQFIQKNRNENT